MRAIFRDRDQSPFPSRPRAVVFPIARHQASPKGRLAAHRECDRREFTHDESAENDEEAERCFSHGQFFPTDFKERERLGGRSPLAGDFPGARPRPIAISIPTEGGRIPIARHQASPKDRLAAHRECDWREFTASACSFSGSAAPAAPHQGRRKPARSVRAPTHRAPRPASPPRRDASPPDRSSR